jgi:cysteine desulfurase
MILRAYLDNNATTRLAPEALAAMTPYLTDLFLNPSSTAGELFGAARPLAEARQELAALLGAPDVADHLVLTSGATEANSWAVHAAIHNHPPGHLVSTAIEHPSLLEALAAAETAGWTVDLAQPNATGQVTPDAVAALLRPETRFVSVMLANNETGVIQPVGEIGGRLCQVCPEALFHVDATQAIGRIAVDLDDALARADFVSLSAHKFHGPKGIGALLVGEGVQAPALIHGSQAGGQRGGTPDAAAAAGLAVAAMLARTRLQDMVAVAELRDHFERALLDLFPQATVVGRAAARLPNTSTFVLPGLDGDAAVEALALQGIVLATGSACTSGSPKPSHVLLAMGLSYADAKSSLRISISRESTAADLSFALDALIALQRLAA